MHVRGDADDGSSAPLGSSSGEAAGAPHTAWDFSVDSTANVAAYDPGGNLWSFSSMTPGVTPERRAIGPAGNGLSAPVKIGAGWNGLSFNLLDWDKDGNTDVVAKNASGQLKLFRTNGAGSFIFENRATIGSGWNSMSSIRAVSGLHGSGSVGLRARDWAGVLHYYQAIKSAWAPRETYTNGWGSYTIAGN